MLIVAAKLQNIPEKTYFWVNICKKKRERFGWYQNYSYFCGTNN
jgi:hypothetical protein